jgi:hypothetical protein
MVPARLNVVTLGARDLARLRSFYSALGWEPEQVDEAGVMSFRPC